MPQTTQTTQTTQATQTIAGLFDDIQEAERTVQDLVGHGFPHRDISLITADAAGDYARYVGGQRSDSLAAEAAGGGAVIGGLAGLLVGLGALTIPGIGAVIAAGPLFGLIGAGLGAVAGGLLGGLVKLGVPEQNAEYYAEGVRRGGTLVVVTASDKLAERAKQIIERHGPVDLNQRSMRWRSAGWTSFNPSAPPLSGTDLQRERDLAAGYNDRIGSAGAGAGSGQNVPPGQFM